MTKKDEREVTCKNGKVVPGKTILKEMLGCNKMWALRALTLVYSFQTASEQQIEATTDHNGVGFSAFDADILSSFAKQVERGRTLSDKQFALLFKKMPRYWRQVRDVAISKNGGEEINVEGTWL